MKQIFGRAWLILGHESQIPKPGDFFRTEMARQQVIVSRHVDGVVHVLLNRCQHRGSLVCHKQSGNARQFACPYHGWTYATDGELRTIPIVQGYEPGAKEKMKTLGLSHVQRLIPMAPRISSFLMNRPMRQSLRALSKHSGHNGIKRRGDDARVGTDAPTHLTVGVLGLYVGHCRCL